MDPADMTLELTDCPECGVPAEIVRHAWLESTDGLIEHVQVRCLDRHVFFLAADRVRHADASELTPAEETSPPHA